MPAQACDGLTRLDRDDQPAERYVETLDDLADSNELV